MPEPERKLWYFLRKKQIQGVKFRRQCSIGKYIVDFYSFEKKLVIEVDGDSHFVSEEAEKYDQKRSQYIQSNGLRILRFTNIEIMQNIEGCIARIEEVLMES